MGGCTAEGHFELIDGKACGLEAIKRPRVNHHRRMDAVEDASFEHENFSAPRFFCRGSEHLDGEIQLVCDFSQPNASANCGGGNEVVTTGVPDLGECVIFSNDRKHEAPGSIRGFECGRELGNSLDDIKAGRTKHVRRKRGRRVFLKRQFWLSVDGLRERDEGRLCVLDGVERPDCRVAHRRPIR